LNDQSTRQAGTRDRIVEAARELFYEHGYTATGIAQILKASGTNSGSLYHFFPSKEDILIAVLEKYKAMLGPHVLAPCYQRASDPIERIFTLLHGYRRLLEQTDFALGCPIGNLALEVGNSHPRARELIAENFEAWSDAVRDLIHDAAGRLPEGVDSDALARHVLATMEGAVMLARSYRSFEPFDQAAHQLRDYFDRLVREGTEWPIRGPASRHSPPEEAPT
jgi:TetR/AcrR family transcriptional regulator, transcriptional repressor for nem operon